MANALHILRRGQWFAVGHCRKSGPAGPSQERGASTSAWFGDTAVEVADRLNPIGGPAGPLKARALFAAFRPSLMPRAAWHQGAAAGVSLLAAYVVGGTVNGTIERVVPPTAHLGLRLGARGLVAGVGLGLQRLPESDDEPTAVASVRAAGRLAAAAAIGGVIHEGALAVRDTLPPKSAVRPVVMGAGGLAGALLYSRIVAPSARGSGGAADQGRQAGEPARGSRRRTRCGRGGSGTGAVFRVSRASSVRFFGDDPAHAAVGRLTNAALWGAGLATLYSAGVGYIARTNEKVEPAYSAPPDHGVRIGWTRQRVTLRRAGFAGTPIRHRRRDAGAHRTGARRAGGRPSHSRLRRGQQRARLRDGSLEMMMDELERLGAFERSHLLLVSPTGTGWVDQTMIEAAEAPYPR